MARSRLYFTKFLQAFLGAGILGLSFGAASPAYAQSITLQGRVLDSSNNPLTDSSVLFRVRILAPDANLCVLYDETQTLDLSQSNGFFSLSLNDGTGTQNAPTTYTLEQSLANNASFLVNSTYCSAGAGVVTYTPGASDERKILIEFKDSVMAGWEAMPTTKLTAVPFAIDARSVGGFPVSALLRVDAGGGVPGTAAVLSSAAFTEIQSLAAGTSSQYVTSSTAAGSKLPTYAGAPASPTAGSVWFDTGTGSVKYYDGTTVQTVGASGGAPGGAAGGDLSGTYPNPTVAKLQGTAVSNTAPASGQFLRYGGASWGGALVGLSDLTSTSVGNPALFSAPACTSAQTLSWSAGSDQFSCQAIGSLDAGVITTGTIASARLPASANVWADGGSGAVYYSGGNVGIGTASPTGRLQIVQSGVNAIDLSRFGSNWGTGMRFQTSYGTQGSPTQAGANAYTGTSEYMGMDETGTFRTTAKIYSQTEQIVTSADSRGRLVFATTSPGSTSESEKMRIDSAGNVGIGTTSPAVPLHVTSANTAYQLKVGQSATGYAPASVMLEGSESNARGQGVFHYNTVSQTSWFSGVPYNVAGAKWVVGYASQPTFDPALAQTSNALFTIQNNGNVGIGTTSPGSLLTVGDGTSAGNGITVTSGSGSYLELYRTGQSHWKFLHTGNGLAIQNNWTGTTYRSALTLDDGLGISTTPLMALKYSASGNRVGIGTATVSAGLDVQNAIDAASGASIGGRFKQTLKATAASDALTALYVDPTFNDNGQTGVTHNGLVVASGNVGIGTTTPQYPLDVAGATHQTGPAAFENSTATSAGQTFSFWKTRNYAAVQDGDELGYISFYGHDGTGIYRSAYMGGFVDAVPASGTHTVQGRLSFFTTPAGASDSSERMRITSAGDIGIGSTAPSEKLHVVGNLRVQGSTDCTLGNGAGGTNCSSDIRLKDGVREIDDALAKVLALRGVEFTWNDKSQSPGRRGIGVIAQEVEKQFPTAVIEDPRNGYKKVDYAVLVAPLLQALKEIHARLSSLFGASERQGRAIASLQAEAAAREARIRALERENAAIRERLERIERKLASP